MISSAVVEDPSKSGNLRGPHIKALKNSLREQEAQLAIVREKYSSFQETGKKDMLRFLCNWVRYNPSVIERLFDEVEKREVADFSVRFCVDWLRKTQATGLTVVFADRLKDEQLFVVSIARSSQLIADLKAKIKVLQ
jgi:hypothetical protein